MAVLKYKPVNWVEFLDLRNKDSKSEYDAVLNTCINCAKLMSYIFDISGADIYVSKNNIIVELIFDLSYLVINKVPISKCKDEDAIWKLLLKISVKNLRMYEEYKKSKI